MILRQSSGSFPEILGFIEVGAIALAIIGLFMVVWVAATFVARGRGTAVPLLPPTEFVAEGLFKFIRNPMYFGLVLVIVAEAIFFHSWWLLLYAFVTWSLMHSYVVLIEEPRLSKRFGETYINYLEETPRWIPSWPSRRRN
jgi:protein-S-isoprenylcysteine O-methyltransferase Ste14